MKEEQNFFFKDKGQQGEEKFSIVKSTQPLRRFTRTIVMPACYGDGNSVIIVSCFLVGYLIILCFLVLVKLKVLNNGSMPWMKR